MQGKGDKKDEESPPTEPPADVRAIVEALTRLSKLRDSRVHEGYPGSIDLRSTDLQGADF